MPPDLTTVVVSWNTVDLLDDCLGSIAHATDGLPDGFVNEVVVVDNGSTDGSAAHVAEHWPQVRLIANTTNLGFCRANNQAIRSSDSPTVLLVNTDARLEPGGIASLLAYFEADPRAAVVGPRLAYRDGAFQRWTAGQLPSPSSMAAYLFALERISPRFRSHYLTDDTAIPFQPEWVSSAVMALRRAALDEIGLLDEQIFVYMDDVDLCARARAAGWNVWYAADTTATHFMGASSAEAAAGRPSPAALRALNRWYADQHGPTASRQLQAMEVLGFGARAAVSGLGALLGPPRTRRTGRQRLGKHTTHLRQALEPIDV